MLQQDKPDDYVIATGETHSVRELLDVVFGYARTWTGRSYVEIDPRYFRPAEVDLLLGDASKARRSWAGSPRSFRGADRDDGARDEEDVRSRWPAAAENLTAT